MKKSLVMAMVMGVTASAYAANPFSDVPAGHWAYDAVAQLAAAGVVDGYGTTFDGEKLMTRYEMAQIVAKAMAKGGNCDKLAAEFADELDALGVRVAKLEKKVDNVKVTGNIRYSYAGRGGDDDKVTGVGSQYNRFRTRLFVNGQINDSWSYTGMLENDRMLSKTDDRNVDGKNGGDRVALKRAFVNGRLGGIKMRAGRVYLIQPDMIDAEGDGVELKYGLAKNWNLTGWIARNVNTDAGYRSLKEDDSTRLYMAKVDAKFGNLGAFIEYWKVSGNGGKIWEIGLNHPIGKDWSANFQYYRGDANEDSGIEYSKNGYEVGVKYAGAKAAKPGTWGAWATYSSRPLITYIKPSTIGTYAYSPINEGYGFEGEDGYKGFEIGANWAMAKNIVLTGRYYDLKGRNGGDYRSHKVKTYWADVTFTF